MTREQSREELINKLINRNLYLESVILGKKIPELKEVLSSTLVHIVKENDTGKIIGVLSDENIAHNISEDSFRDSSVESWEIAFEEFKNVPQIIIPVGSLVRVQDENKIFDGAIIKSDEDLSLGIENVLYHVLPKGLQDGSSDCIVISHHEIKAILNDNFEI